MVDKQLVRDIAQRLIDTENLFLVDVTVSAVNDIEVIVDSVDRVTIDHCASLSRAIEGELDREAEDFSLTVASAGIGYPFKVEGQYVKCVGRQVEVVYNGGHKRQAILAAYDGESITLKYDVKELVEGSKRKQVVEKLEKIDKTELKSVCEALTIK